MGMWLYRSRKTKLNTRIKNIDQEVILAKTFRCGQTKHLQFASILQNTNTIKALCQATYWRQFGLLMRVFRKTYAFHAQ